ERPPSRADRRELGLHVLDHDLLALEAADGRRATPLLLVTELLRRAVMAVERLVRGTVVRVARVVAADTPRVGHHAGELPMDVGRRVGQVHRVPVALAHLSPRSEEHTSEL